MARDLVLEVIEQVKGNALGEAKRDLDQLGDSTDSAATSAKDYTAQLAALDKQIAATRIRIQELGAEFASTHDKATGKELRGERSLVRQLEQIRKELEDAAGPLSVAVGNAAGEGFSTGILQSLGSLGGNLRGAVLPLGIAAGIYLAPAIGAAISGAVVGGVAAGGVVGGIYAASRDEGVRAEAKALGALIQEQFFGGVGDQFADPVRQALRDLGDDFKTLDIPGLFGKAVPAVEILGEGVGDLAQNLMPGLNAVMDQSRPIAEALAEGMDNIGDATSDALIDMMQSKGTLEGLRVTFMALADVIRAAGTTTAWLGDRYDELVQISGAVAGVMEDIYDAAGDSADVFQRMSGIPLGDWLHGLADRFGAGSDRADDLTGSGEGVVQMMYRAETATALLNAGLDPFGAYLRDAAKHTAELKVNLSELFGVQLNVEESTIRWEKSLDDLTAAVKENGRSTDVTTESGRAVRSALLDAVQAAIAQRDAMYAATGSTQQANAMYQAQIEKLIALAQKLGLSKQEIDKLVGNYQVSIFVDTYYRVHKPKYAPGFDPEGVMDIPTGHNQHGGYPGVGEAFWVGEAGPELMGLWPRPQVYSAAESKLMASRATHRSSSWGRGGGDDLAWALRRALNGATLILDDRTGRTATIYTRGG